MYNNVSNLPSTRDRPVRAPTILAGGSDSDRYRSFAPGAHFYIQQGGLSFIGEKVDAPKKRKRQVEALSEVEGSIDADESKTEDIYQGDQRDEMLEDDEITAAEDGFMRGRDLAMKEMEEERKARRKPIIHADGKSVTLNEQQYEED